MSCTARQLARATTSQPPLARPPHGGGNPPGAVADDRGPRRDPRLSRLVPRRVSRTGGRAGPVRAPDQRRRRPRSAADLRRLRPQQVAPASPARPRGDRRAATGGPGLRTAHRVHRPTGRHGLRGRPHAPGRRRRRGGRRASQGLAGVSEPAADRPASARRPSARDAAPSATMRCSRGSSGKDVGRPADVLAALRGVEGAEPSSARDRSRHSSSTTPSRPTRSGSNSRTMKADAGDQPLPSGHGANGLDGRPRQQRQRPRLPAFRRLLLSPAGRGGAATMSACPCPCPRHRPRPALPATPCWPCWRASPSRCRP